MRAFLAINLSKDVKDYLYDFQKELKLPAKIKWVEKKNLHLTLKFFGDVNTDNLEEIKTRLKKIKFKKFKVKLNEIGFFPDSNFIRVVWVDLKPAGKVIKLQQKIDSELLTLFSKDQRFQAHLTLGRVKFIKDKERFRELLKIKIKPIEFLIDKFELMKSDLTKDGPRYNVLETYDLR